MGKIIWIAHESNISGANLCMIEYIKFLNEIGHNQLVIVPHKGLLQENILKLGISVRIIHYRSWTCNNNETVLNWFNVKRIIRNSIAIYQLIRLYISYTPDFVCTNTVATSVGAIAAKLTFKKHFWFIHEFGYEDHGFDFIYGKKHTHKLINYLSDKVIVNSQCVYDYYSVYISKAKLILQYYLLQIPDIESILPDYSYTNSQKINLILIGQISAGKGHIDLLDSLKVLDEKKSFLLNIIGNISDDAYYHKLKDKINQYKLSDIVKIYSYIPNPYNIIKAHEYLIMTSRSEAFGRVTLEALQLGVPVIGRRSGGTKEIILDKFNGLLYDNLNELTAILENVVQRKINYEMLYNNTIKSVNEKFNKKKLSNELEAIFK